MAIKSLGSTGVLYTDRRDFYISPLVIKELWTSVAPFTTIISNRGTTTPPDPLFKMFEHRAKFHNQYMLGTGADSVPNDDTGVTLNIGTVNGLVADSSLIGMTFECWSSDKATKRGVVVCTAVASTTQITVKLLGTVAFTTAVGDIFYVTGTAFGEGSSSPDAFSDELEVVYNSTEIFRTPIEITGTLLQAALRGTSNELARLRDLKNKEHKMQKERAFLFGQSVMGTGMSGTAFADTTRTDANGKKIRTTMGLVAGIEKYGYGRVGSSFGQTTSDETLINEFEIVQSSYKYSNFVDDMELAFQFIPEAGAKTALCGMGAMSYWSKMEATNGIAGKSGWQVKLSESRPDTLGFNYRVLETPHGIINLVPTPAFKGARKSQMLVVSEENLQHVQYRAPRFRANIKTDNAPDLVKDEYFSDEGVGYTLIESHKLFNIR
jgi:hypothetical protein